MASILMCARDRTRARAGCISSLFGVSCERHDFGKDSLRNEPQYPTVGYNLLEHTADFCTVHTELGATARSVAAAGARREASRDNRRRSTSRGFIYRLELGAHWPLPHPRRKRKLTNGLKDSVLRSALSVVLRVLRCPKVHDRDSFLPLRC